MPKKNSETLTVRHNVNTSETTITGGSLSGGNVEIHENHTNTITWNAAGNEGRWVLDGIAITPTGDFSTDRSEPNRIVVTEPGNPGLGEYTYKLRIKVVQTGTIVLYDPAASNMIKKTVDPVIL